MQGARGADGASPSAPHYSYRRQGRNRATLAAVIGVWGVALALIVLVEAAPWVMAILCAFTLPALYDLIANPDAGLAIDDGGLRWHTGKRDAALALEQIDHVRLDTRLDFSVRASVVLQSGRKLRIPLEATPPHEVFEDALRAAGLKVQRHHFSLLG